MQIDRDMVELVVAAVREVATERVERELRELRENLTSVQARCTEQATEIRVLKTALSIAQVGENDPPMVEARKHWSKP